MNDRDRSQPPPVPSVTVRVQLGIGGDRLNAEITVPSGPTSVRIILPMVHSLANAVVDRAVRTVEEEGLQISCKKGCGACCRQLVPISEAEARQIRDLVETLPEPRRSVIRERFAAAQLRLEAAGLLSILRKGQPLTEKERHQLGEHYFRQGIACPFLEDESCSIHPDRPVSCREYLVTSPAENCARPSAEGIDKVPLPGKVWLALARLGVPTDQRVPWVPLILAPEWADAHPEEAPTRTGPELLRELFETLAREKIPDSGE